MEFGAREIMIALGALVFLAIMLNVVRRIRSARYGEIRMPRRKQPIFDEHDFPDDDYGSELPGGGARVVGYRDEEDMEELGQMLRQVAESNKPKLSIPIRETLQTEPSPEKVAPVIMPEQEEVAVEEEAQVLETVSASQPAEEADPQSEISAEQTSARQPVRESAPEKEAPAKAENPGQQSVNTVIALHLMAEKGSQLCGEDLLNTLLDSGLHYGAMKIFHRHTNDDGTGSVIYSVANSVNPGTFDLKNMDQFSTPGISLFYAMEDVDDPEAAFKDMLQTGANLIEALGGNLLDQSRSTITRQTIEHYRERIATYSRDRLSGTA